MPALLASSETAVEWLRARGARRLVSDHRRLAAGDALLAWPGARHDARRYCAPALAAGAAACLVEAEGATALPDDSRIAALAGLKSQAGPLASAFYRHPSRDFALLAVTGTNGKTSCTWWLAQALTALGRRCAVVGTLGCGEPSRLEATGLTTPDAVALQSAFRDFADQGYAACAIEASSIGLVEQRLAGSAVAVALFTNFSRDHLDHHGTMDDYWAAKATLFAWPGLKAAVVNLDDERGADLAASLDGRGVATWTVSARAKARLRARGAGYRDGGLAFEVVEGGEAAQVRTALVGDFNLANLLVVFAGLRSQGISLADAAAACARLTPVPGRMQSVAAPSPGPEVVVDYAHTPDALHKALAALRPLAAQRGGRLWCVFGCGGNRDAAKRPLMGAIAERLADQVVVTSDNPRDEAPDFIIAQILAGVVGHDDVAVYENRRDAIAYAISGADPSDVILVAGKGHEDYQEARGARQPFSDLAVAQELLGARAAGGSR